MIVVNVSKHLRSLMGVQIWYALPSYPGGHIQVDLWLFTSQIALIPHWLSYTHGSLHFWLIHASVLEQSVSTVHSGLHWTYGSPCNPGGQLQIHLSPDVLVIAFNPHGLGSHGSDTVGSMGGGRLHSIRALPMYPGRQEQSGE